MREDTHLSYLRDRVGDEQPPRPSEPGQSLENEDSLHTEMFTGTKRTLFTHSLV